MLFKKTLLATSLITLGGMALNASAATATANMGVSITIENACDVTTTAPTPLDFGTHGVLSTPSDESTTGNITVTCTSGAAYDIGLDAGANASTANDTSTRRMALTGTFITYQLYSDPARTTVWGNAVGTDTVLSTGTGTAQSFPVYGVVPAQTTPAAGVYSDSVVVTVTY